MKNKEKEVIVKLAEKLLKAKRGKASTKMLKKIIEENKKQ